MLCELHSVYKIIHCIHCVILHRGSQIIIHYTVKGQFFAFNLEKNYTRQKKFTQTPPVVSVTNMRYGDIETSLQTHPNIISPYPPKVTANLVPFVMISLSTRMCWRSRSSLKRWSSGNCRPDCWSPEDHWWSDKNSDKWSSKLQTWNPYIFNSVLILKAGEVWTLWYFKYRCKTMTDHLDVGLCQWWWWWVALILQWLSWVIPGDCYGRHSR